MNTNAKEFRLVLQEELLKRCRKNPGYSLRAFARVLQCDASTLSKMLNGKRSIGRIAIKNFSQKLSLSPNEFVLPVQKRPNRKPSMREVTKSQPDFHQLAADQFAAISEWYHYAILELILLKDFKPETRWIAKKLSITVSEANAAVERLFRLGLLKTAKNGSWVSASGHHTNVTSDMSAAAYRSLQRQLLEKALQALDTVPLEFRDQSSITVALDSRRLPEIIEEITLFRRRLAAYMDQTSPKDSVYQLSISFFPTTLPVTRKASLKNV